MSIVLPFDKKKHRHFTKEEKSLNPRSKNPQRKKFIFKFFLHFPENLSNTQPQMSFLLDYHYQNLYFRDPLPRPHPSVYIFAFVELNVLLSTYMTSVLCLYLFFSLKRFTNKSENKFQIRVAFFFFYSNVFSKQLIVFDFSVFFLFVSVLLLGQVTFVKAWSKNPR